MSKIVFSAGFLAALGLMAVLGYGLGGGRRIGDRRFNTIRPGMSEYQVVAVFGARAGSYDGAVPAVLPRGKDKVWASKHGAYVVTFDGGRVSTTAKSRNVYIYTSFERLVQFLGCQLPLDRAPYATDF
jgi:hypothetical protein